MPWITKIELKGFKSFGNAKVEIPLSRGLTAIIGRNGHGKSNIVDALCFVFGGRSVKSMRGERFTDFIYTRNQRILAPYAEVSIHINNEDGGLPLDSNTVVVSRRVDRSGRCTYRLNGKRVDQHEIVDLLSPVMGGPNDFNFVMQGQIKKIFAMNAIERRQIIDQLAGVSEYDEKRKDIEQELDRVNNNLRVLQVRVDEIQRRVESLRRQVQRYIAYRDMKIELEKLEAAYTRKKEKELEKHLRRLNERLKKKRREIERYKEKARELGRKADEHNSKATKLWQLVSEKQRSGILAKTQEWESELHVYQGMLRDIRSRQAKIEKELERLKSEAPREWRFSSNIEALQRLKANIRSLVSRFANVRALEEAKQLAGEVARLLDELERVLGSIVEEFGKKQLKMQDIQKTQRMIQLSAELKLYQQKIDEFHVRVKELRHRIERFADQKRRLELNIESLKKRAESFAQKSHRLRELANAYYTRALKIGETIGQLESRRGEVKLKLEELAKKKSEVDYSEYARLSLDQLSRKIAELKARISELGEVNPHAVGELKEEESRWSQESEKLRKLEEEKQKLLEKLQQLDQKKKEVFMKVYQVVAEKFSQIFYEISGGCRGELVLENPENPFEGGLEIRADFDGGPSRGLSGGQQTLTAVALLLALQRYRPSTFYVLDEMDESLDPYNRKLVAKLLKEYSRESQIVVVTLHNTLAAVADRVFGVVKDNGVSKIFSVELSGLGD